MDFKSFVAGLVTGIAVLVGIKIVIDKPTAQPAPVLPPPAASYQQAAHAAHAAHAAQAASAGAGAVGAAISGAAEFKGVMADDDIELELAASEGMDMVVSTFLDRTKGEV